METELGLFFLAVIYSSDGLTSGDFGTHADRYRAQTGIYGEVLTVPDDDADGAARGFETAGNHSGSHCTYIGTGGTVEVYAEIAALTTRGTGVEAILPSHGFVMDGPRHVAFVFNEIG